FHVHKPHAAYRLEVPVHDRQNLVPGIQLRLDVQQANLQSAQRLRVVHDTELQALGLLGVVDSQVEAVSFGKEKPAAQGSDEDAMAKNRRAEISYR
ncbi:MAG: hypothetical protein ABI606_07780, partial [Rhodoferax sp.]